MKKKVFITGANGSLGLALTKKFNDENYDLFLNLRKVDHNIKKFIKFRNSKIEIVKGDLTKNKTLKIISEKIKKNNVELLINNAGLYLNKEFDIKLTSHQREKEVERSRQVKARKNDLREKFIRKLYHIIMVESRKIEKKGKTRF